MSAASQMKPAKLATRRHRFRPHKKRSITLRLPFRRRSYRFLAFRVGFGRMHARPYLPHSEADRVAVVDRVGDDVADLPLRMHKHLRTTTICTQCTIVHIRRVLDNLLTIALVE
jgi:hypothetical protein